MGVERAVERLDSPHHSLVAHKPVTSKRYQEEPTATPYAVAICCHSRATRG
jgi:hypothetical protein